MTVIRNTCLDAAGNPIAGALVRITLIVSATSRTPGYLANGDIIGTVTTATDQTGTWTADLAPNASITPANTYYQVNETGYLSTIVVPASGGPYNLSQVIVTPPTPAAPGITGVQVAANGTIAGNRPEVNFVAGSNIAVTATDDPAGNKVDVEITASLTLPNTILIQAAPPSGSAATDTTNIQTALTAAANAGGGVVQLQPGTYLIQAPADPSTGGVHIGDHTTLAGWGMGVTTLQVAAGTSAPITGVVRTPSGVQNTDITVRNLTIDGNAANLSGAPAIIGFFSGVTPNSTQTDTDIRLFAVEVQGCTQYGFDPHERTTRLLMVACVAHDNGTDGSHDGFTLDGCYDAELIGCVSYNNGRHGFNLVTASTRVRLSACEAYGNTGNGYTAQNGAKYATYAGCQAYNNTGAGWVLNGVPQTGQQDNTPGGLHTLTGCTAAGSGTYGFQLVGCSHNRLVGCHSQDASGAANNTSDHYRLDESGTTYSTDNTLSGCTWGQTSGVTNAAKYGIGEKTTNDGPTYVLGCAGSGTTTAALALLNPTSLLAVAHSGGSNGHPVGVYTADQPSFHGYKEWNWPPDLAGASAGVVLVAGTIYGARIDSQAGQQISTVTVAIGTAGTSMTAGQCVASVIDGSSGLELARTADISTLLQGSGVVDLPLTSTFTPTPGQKLCVMLLANTAGAMPQLVRNSSTSAITPNAGLTSTSPRRYFTAGTGQTSLPASFTMSGTSASGALTVWAALK